MGYVRAVIGGIFQFVCWGAFVNFIRIAVVIILLVSGVFGQDKAAKTNRANPKDMHGLIINGQGFVFLASEPDGWDTDTDARAREYGVNAIFFPRTQSSRSHHVNIRVRLNEKTTEDPNEDMAEDVSNYKKQYPLTKFADLNVKHGKYTTSAKIFYTDNEFYEYVAYLNPGPKHKFMFSVAMSKEKQAATADELAAFSHVLRSLNLVSE